MGASLIAALKHFSGPAWTAELEHAWTSAYTLVAQAMTQAAEEAARTEPPWWDAEVTAHDRRTVDVAVLTIRPASPLPYRAGQSVTVETPLRPKLWRYYSPANHPREDGSIELHIQLIDGGPVSAALVRQLRPGDVVRVGAAVGGPLTLSPDAGTDLLLVAGGSGLAPLKALIEQVGAEGGRRRVHLFHGARRPSGLYDLPALERLAAACPWLAVTAAVSHDDAYAGYRGLVGDLATQHGAWPDRDAYVCGSAAMVRATVPRLAQAGLPEAHIHYDTCAAR